MTKYITVLLAFFIFAGPAFGDPRPEWHDYYNTPQRDEHHDHSDAIIGGLLGFLVGVTVTDRLTESEARERHERLEREEREARERQAREARAYECEHYGHC